MWGTLIKLKLNALSYFREMATTKDPREAGRLAQRRRHLFETLAQRRRRPETLAILHGHVGSLPPWGTRRAPTRRHQPRCSGSGATLGSDKLGSRGHGWTSPDLRGRRVASLELIDKLDLVTNARDTRLYFRTELAKALADQANVGEVRGDGLLAGVEFVADKGDRIFFDPAKKIGPQIATALAERGASAAPCRKATSWALRHPLCLTKEEADIVVEKTTDAVKAVFAGLWVATLGQDEFERADTNPQCQWIDSGWGTRFYASSCPFIRSSEECRRSSPPRHRRIRADHRQNDVSHVCFRDVAKTSGTTENEGAKRPFPA
jgi:aminotransferase class III